MGTKNDRAERDECFRGMRRISRHPLQRLQVGLQPASLGIARNPLHAYASEVLAGGHDGLGQLVGRQVDDEVVDDAAVDFFSTISTALMSAPTLPMAVATDPSEPGRSGRVIRIRNT